MPRVKKPKWLSRAEGCALGSSGFCFLAFHCGSGSTMLRSEILSGGNMGGIPEIYAMMPHACTSLRLPDCWTWCVDAPVGAAAIVGGRVMDTGRGLAAASGWII